MKFSLAHPIALALFPLMIDAEYLAPSGKIRGAGCTFKYSGASAVMNACGKNFKIEVIGPNWAHGEYWRPLEIAIEGDLLQALRWLPLENDEKEEVISEFECDDTAKVLLILGL